MSFAIQELWYVVVAGVALFEVIKSRAKSWMPIFCALVAAAIFLEKAEGAAMLIFGFFMLLLQNLQVQKSETETYLRTQKVILGFIGGLIFLSSSLQGDIVGLICLLIFVFLITTDWPFGGVLKTKQDEEVVETNTKALIYVPISILISNVYVPGQEWIAYTFFAYSFILFWGADKDRGLFLLFCGISWLKPELRALAPAITVLCMGSKVCSLVLQLIIGYLVATLVLPLDMEVSIGIWTVAGIFVGWMLADRSLPQFKNFVFKERSRDLIYLAIAILSVILSVLFVIDAEKVLMPQPEYFVFVGAVLLTEVLKRNIKQLSKFRFEKALSKSVQDIFEFIPFFRTQEREELAVGSRSSTKHLIFLPERSLYLEHGFITIGIFAAILWSIVIWFYCST